MTLWKLGRAGGAIAAMMAVCGGLAFARLPEDPKAKASEPPKNMPDLTKQPTLFVVGYAHLDTQWRWTYVDTIREFIPSTLNDNFRLFEKYPSYVFNFSGSRRYRMMEEYYPEGFKTLHKYVADGRWFPCGSSVDENDANVPSAESLVRQVLYGNKYFRKEFGVASDEYMLPDCFGFPAALPSVLSHCGIKGFSTQKLTWGGVVPIPFKVGKWFGPDGHGVMAALDPGAYVGEVKENLANSQGWLERIKNSAKTSGVFADYHYFGTGDTGGAPKEPSVAMVEESTKTDGAIKVVSGPADWLFRSITPEIGKNLPTYQGELMLTEHSAGSISSQAYMKRWNRKNEFLADAAERASLAAWWLGARAYPSQKLEDAWYLVLGSQMHDILPGTSLPTAYEYSWNDEVIAADQFTTIIEDASSAVISAMDTSAKGTAVVVYNPLSFARQDVVEATMPGLPGVAGGAKGVKVTAPDGSSVPAQILDTNGGKTRVAFLAPVDSVSYGVFDVVLSTEAAAGGSLKVSESQLENEYFVVKLDGNGDVCSVYDKQAKRETLSAPMTLSLNYENPRNWPAWNQDWADRQLAPKAIVGGPAKVRIVENGAARVAIEVVRQAEGSTITQRIALSAGDAGKRVEFHTDVDWRSKERSLRAAFPLAASNPTATFDIQTGAVERPNSHAKQYEYSFHHWLDLTDTSGTHGASVMCDSKYAGDKPDDHTVRLTLLYTPGTRGGYPDQATQDIGRHHIVYAFYPHSDDWRQAQTYAQAKRLNQAMVPMVATSHAGKLGKSFSLVSCSDAAVTINALKKAEASDEIIVRLREQTGKKVAGAKITFNRPILSAREVDGQERDLGTASVKDGRLVTDMGGYELRAFAIKLGEAPVKVKPVESKPIDVALDADVVSTNKSRGDGAMSPTLGAMPAEQFPRTISSEGVTFTLGSGADGAKNAMTCRGQTIEVPSAGYDRVYVLAAADGDVSSKIEVDGKAVAWNVPNWTGFIGQWDNRLWPGNIHDPAYRWNDAPIGLVPGFIKDADVAWYCSHRHTPAGDAFYQYSYIFRSAIDLPAGAKQIKLPDDPRIKVFAVSAAKFGADRAVPAAPMFDTLKGHDQDAPVLAGAGSYKDTMMASIEPGLYWRDGSIRYTTDGTPPTPSSPVYDGAIEINKPTTITAAVFDPAGKPGPIASGKYDVNDTTPPSVKRVDAVFESKMMKVEFSEAVDAPSVTAKGFAITPAIDVAKAEMSADGRVATLTLANVPATGTSYTLAVAGVKDRSPAKNTLTKATANFTVNGPVFSLAEVTAADKGRVIKDVPGLPTKAKDAWTLNFFVKADNQPENRTVIAGFGRCEDSTDGAARYICKFPGGIHFWSRLRDVPTGTPLSMGDWQMVSATYDGTTLRVYRNGQKIGERGLGLADDQNMIEILPKDPWEQKRQFDGQIRGFTVWGNALSEDALKALFAAGSGTK
ncbi:MAG: chitobiase/beta-hexosaminidase C-terminal domain-containing protein [Phycisphaerales bacterium]|nr:chitobiase/beta-hexosaminidase C-terminal domain-containing protein [Phycisphaerales bacterium]